MNTIVETGMKIDLHIHSCYSYKKDGKKVKDNTLDNLSILVDKLNENNVNICSITDHDAFNYELYSMFKKHEYSGKSIKKVLPGIEFCVNFTHKDKSKNLHIVAIFSDTDDEKVKNIESIIEHNQPSKSSYTEKEFLDILRAIDLDTILIAHQKKSLYSTGKNDATALGTEKFFEFVRTDYFEALEFRNKRNETFDKTFLNEQDMLAEMGLVTGTDCHDWSVYPNEEPNKTEFFPFTYAKCLPTFKGLVMAMTDVTRLSTENNFFCTNKFYLKEIEIVVSGDKQIIPLSKGINVIIGENSIGKSLLLHAITGYKKDGILKIDKTTIDGYKSYLKKNNIEIKQQLKKNNIFYFDMQGEVRKKFQSGGVTAIDFLNEYFPQPINSKIYRNMIEREIDRFISWLHSKFEYDNTVKKLNDFPIVLSLSDAESLFFDKNIRKKKPKYDKVQVLVDKITNAQNELKSILESKKELDICDFDIINDMISQLGALIEKYQNRIESIKQESNKMEIVATCIENISKDHDKGVSSHQTEFSAFGNKTSELIYNISSLVKQHRAQSSFVFDIPQQKTKVNSSLLRDYDFVTRLRVSDIDNAYMNSLIKRTLRFNSKICWDTVTEEELKNSLLQYDGITPVLQFFKNAVMNCVDEDLKADSAIIVDGENKYAQMSAGLNSKIYFDLLSFETNQDGVYIIDQPEDNVSQTAIREFLLDRFKTMGKNRQIIMVTHNPQFVVNLDVDNIIFLNNDNGVKFQFGALEYASDEYDILDIVVQNIDGGLDSIKKRWKRYEKTIDF